MFEPIACFIFEKNWYKNADLNVTYTDLYGTFSDLYKTYTDLHGTKFKDYMTFYPKRPIIQDFSSKTFDPKDIKSKDIWSNPGKFFVEKIKAWFSIPKIYFVGLFMIIFNKFFLSIC